MCVYDVLRQDNICRLLLAVILAVRLWIGGDWGNAGIALMWIYYVM